MSNISIMDCEPIEMTPNGQTKIFTSEPSSQSFTNTLTSFFIFVAIFIGVFGLKYLWDFWKENLYGKKSDTKSKSNSSSG